MGWRICGKANVVEDTAIIPRNEALKRDKEQLLEERKLLNEKEEEYNKKMVELETKRTKFLVEQQELTKNLEIRVEEHQQILKLFKKEVSDFRQVFKEFRTIKNHYMGIIDQELDPETFETLKELYFKFKENDKKLCGPKFYQNGVEIDKKDVPSNGEGVIMTNYLCCMEEVLSEGG